MGKFRQFLTKFSARDTSVFIFTEITSVNINGFSRSLLCALILWRSNFGLLMGKFRKFFFASALFVIILVYVNFYQKPGSSNLIG